MMDFPYLELFILTIKLIATLTPRPLPIKGEGASARQDIKYRYK